LKGTWKNANNQIVIIDGGDIGFYDIKGLVYKGDVKSYGEIGGYSAKGKPMKVVWFFGNIEPNEVSSVNMLDHRSKKPTKRLMKVDNSHLYIYDLNNKLIETWNRVE
jgi:hypothetical protein